MLFLVGAVVAGAIVRPGRPHAARPVVSTDDAVRTTPAVAAGESTGTAPTPVTTAPGVEGVVRDDADAPLALAVLTLVTNAGLQADRTVTDDDGRYRLTADRPGAFLLLTVAPGHHPVAEHVLLSERTTVRRDVSAGSDLRARA